ncbi:MAG: serine protease Do [Candidatus Dependentiae bacterium]|nr:serine protease Do [Candidatus Dependentiae bacterium]
MRNNILGIVVGLLSFGLCAAGYWGYTLYEHQAQQMQVYQVLAKELAGTRSQLLSVQQEVRNETASIPTTASNWLHVQKQIEHGVVQVFSSMARINWLRPYRAPDEIASSGSAFFINDKGDMLTNYHVVNQARSVMVRLPKLGQLQYRATVIGVCPERDVALIRLTDKAREEIERKIGPLQSMILGDSDQVGRTQEVMALGFPLGRSSLKSTIGNVSGWEHCGGQSLIQLTSPINPGNSGGPTVNNRGEVIGINSSMVMGAQNTGFFIPINEIKHILNDLFTTSLLRKPVPGGDFSIYLDTMREFLGNPSGGGWYVTHVYRGTMLDRAGIAAGDVIYEVNGYELDCYGEVEVSWATDSRVSVMDLLNRYNIGDTIHLVVYRRGERKECSIVLDDSFILPVRRLFPDFEKVEYEIFAGMVILPLSINVINALLEYDNSLATILTRYARPDAQYEPALIITHIFPDSPAKDAKLLDAGLIIDTINNRPVRTLNDFRAAVLRHKKDKFFTVTTQFDRRFAVLSYDDVREKEGRLAAQNGYAISALVKALGGKR